jgi:hypothetical protein
MEWLRISALAVTAHGYKVQAASGYRRCTFLFWRNIDDIAELIRLSLQSCNTAFSRTCARFQCGLR